MSVSLNELVIRTLQRIDESYQSTSGETAAGSGAILRVDSSWVVVGSGGTERTTIENVKDYLNQAQEEWFTTAGYLEGSLLVSWTSGLSTKSLHDAPFSGGSGKSYLWALEQVTAADGSVIKRTSRGDLDRNAPGWLSASAGTPAYWYQVQSQVRLYPTPSTTRNITIDGLALPERLSGSVSSTALRDDDARRILPLIASIFLLRRKFTAPEMFGRLEELAAEYQDLYSRHRSRIDPDIVRRHYREMSPDLQPGKR